MQQDAKIQYTYINVLPCKYSSTLEIPRNKKLQHTNSDPLCNFHAHDSNFHISVLSPSYITRTTQLSVGHMKTFP
jgi:hypothetical protein